MADKSTQFNADEADARPMSLPNGRRPRAQYDVVVFVQSVFIKKYYPELAAEIDEMMRELGYEQQSADGVEAAAARQPPSTDTHLAVERSEAFAVDIDWMEGLDQFVCDDDDVD